MPDINLNCLVNLLILHSLVYNVSLLYMLELVSTNLPLQLAQSQTCKLGQWNTNLGRICPCRCVLSGRVTYFQQIH